MINTSSTVLAWYQQRKAPPLKLFQSAVDKMTKVSIHSVVNLNAGGIGQDHKHKVSNTLALLRLVRKRGDLSVDYLETVSLREGPHKDNAYRLMRRWLKANNR